MLIHVTLPQGDGVMCSRRALLQAALPISPATTAAAQPQTTQPASADWRAWKHYTAQHVMEGEPTAEQYCCRAPEDGGMRNEVLGCLPLLVPVACLQTGSAPPVTSPVGKNSGVFRDFQAASFFPCPHSSSDPPAATLTIHLPPCTYHHRCSQLTPQLLKQSW